jgi:succinate dehydrogenase / fumarate reductase, cytochrome b subunit
MKDVRDALMIGHRSDGTTIRRPLSPHLQIYRPQITSVLSIANRICGVAVSVGTLLLVWWLVASAGSPKGFAAMQGFIGSWFGLLLLFGWTLALMYHFVAGIRHLAWDSGYGWELPQVYASGYATLAATAILTVGVWIVGLIVWA